MALLRTWPRAPYGVVGFIFIFIFILLAGARPHLLGWFMLAAAGIPAGDALTVLRSNGPKAAVYGIHGATAVVMMAISVLLLVE